jgi:formylglycine-generating enzyme required for sulfatase activity
MPGHRFVSIIEGPAKRYGVVVDTSLVDALVEDTPKEDALPLLAFALQRLWHQYAASGALTKENYERIGGLKALIEDAAERALRGLAPGEDAPMPTSPVTKSVTDLGASTFVPALAQINDQGAVIRSFAAWSSFTDEQQKLLERFSQWRLVVRKGDENGGTVEVAHEALFREWTRLRGWLEPERMRLRSLRSLQLDAATWDRNGRDANFLNHRGKRLAEALTLASLEGYKKRLNALELDYLSTCQEVEWLARRQARRIRVVVGVLACAVAAAFAGWLNEDYLVERINWFMTMRPYMIANFRPHLLTAEAEQALRPEASFRECAKDCPEMVVVPAGTFSMGSSDSEPGHYNDEAPQHLVTIGKPFAVSKFDVTFDEWDACASVGGCPHVGDSDFGRGSKPVINVTWDDAQKYVAWLSLMTGHAYRLLSEAEWEYSARAGTVTAYYWGGEVGVGKANCTGCGGEFDGKNTSAVGSFSPNAFGLYDMEGNVWQWVQECVHDNYVGAPTDGSTWPGGDCNRHIIRGGAWNYDPRNIRVAIRGRNTTVGRVDYTGIRVGRTVRIP